MNSSLGSKYTQKIASVSPAFAFTAMAPAQQFGFFTSPGSQLPEAMQRWPQGVLFHWTSLSEYVLRDTQGNVFASLVWQGAAPSNDQAIWRLDVRQQSVAWCSCGDWPVLVEGIPSMQHWFAGVYPCQQVPLAAVCWPMGAPSPTWAGVYPQPPPPPTPDPEAVKGVSLQLVLDELRQMRCDAACREKRDAEAWAEYEERAWYAQEESMASYYERACQQAHEMQKAGVERMENHCKALEEQVEARYKFVEDSCKDAVDSIGERCQRAEEKADAAVHTAEFIVRDAKEEVKQEVEAMVDKRVEQRIDERMDRAFRCIQQRMQSAQLSLALTARGLSDAILDGKAGDDSESTRSRSRSPVRVPQGLWL